MHHGRRDQAPGAHEHQPEDQAGAGLERHGRGQPSKVVAPQHARCRAPVNCAEHQGADHQAPPVADQLRQPGLQSVAEEELFREAVLEEVAEQCPREHGVHARIAHRDVHHGRDPREEEIRRRSDPGAVSPPKPQLGGPHPAQQEHRSGKKEVQDRVAHPARVVKQPPAHPMREGTFTEGCPKAATGPR